jgi:hypothetical protein
MQSLNSSFQAMRVEVERVSSEGSVDVFATKMAISALLVSLFVFLFCGLEAP